MNARAVAAIALTLAALARADAADALPEQALVLPMERLVAQLRGGSDWCLLPLADYRGLIASARAADAGAAPAVGAFIESARLVGRITAETGGAARVLRVSGSLTIVSLGDGVARCPVFAAPPDQLSGDALTIGEGRARSVEPALWASAPRAADGAQRGIDAIVAHRGRSTLSVAWSARLAAGDDRFAGRLALPLAASLDLRIAADEPGELLGEGVAAAADGWRIARARQAALPLAWRPGDARGGRAVLFGVDQHVAVTVGQRDALAFRWQAQLEPRLGALPARVRVALPRGWHAGAAADGIARIEETDGVLVLERLRDARDLALEGWLDADAAIDLPHVDGAAYEGGVVSLALPPGDAVAWRQPGSWRAVAAADAARAFAVPAPGDPLAWRAAQAIGDDRVAVAARLAVGPQRWRLDERTVLTCGGDRLRVALRLPPGWTVVALSTRLRDGAARTVDPDTLAAGGDVAIELGGAAHARDDVVIDLALERDGAPWRGVPLVTVVGVARADAHLDVAAAPGLDLRIEGADGWRAGEGAAAPGLRASLVATGEPARIALATAPRGWDGDAEAVLCVLARASDSRVRLDLRLRARDAELGELALSAPFADDAPVVASDGSHVERDGDRWRIRFPSPWRGERTVRLEGRFAGDAAARVALAAPLTQLVVIQATDDVEARWAAPADAAATDLDALPAWSAPFPLVPVVEAARLTAADGALGALTIAPRPLAGVATAFVDGLVIRAQVEAAGTRLLARGRICAPGVASVALTPPPGMRLVLATIDGERAAVRRDGAGWALPLPGRTQVEIAALFVGDAPADRLVLAPPRFAALPTTRIGWTVAVAGDLAARSRGDLRLAPSDTATRGPWRAWRRAREQRIAAAGDDDAAAPPVAIGDARALQPVPAADDGGHRPARGEPTLALVGALWTATHRGDPCPVVLDLARVDRLAWLDAIGRVLGVLVAVGAIAVVRPRAQWLLAAAAACVVAACLAAQRPCGVLLGCAESLAPALIAWQLVRRVPLRLLVATVIVVGVAPGDEATTADEPTAATEAAPAAAPDQVLMGYRSLGLGGVPQDIVVALTHERLDELARRARHEPDQSAPCDLALGEQRVRLRLAGDTIEGETTLPVAVLTTRWQDLRLPLGGTVRSVRLLPAAGEPAAQVAWRNDRGVTTVTLEGRRRGVLVVGFALHAQELADGGQVECALPPAPAGVLTVTLPDAWEAAVEGLPVPERAAADAGTATWTVALPPEATHAVVRWRRPAIAAAAAAPRATQDVLVVLAPGRLEWRDRIAVATRGSPLLRARIRVPDGVAVTTVESARLADWHQDGAVVDLAWTVPQPAGAVATLAGVLTRSAQRRAATVIAHVEGSEDGGGRLALRHGAGERFALPAGVERADPRDGEDLAARWHDGGDVAVAWAPVERALAARTRVEFVAGRDRIRAHVTVAIVGHGEADALALRVPPPWRVTSDARSALTADGDDARVLQLRTAEPWRDGMTAQLELEADRAAAVADDGTIVLPGLEARGDIGDERQTWIVGDAGDRRALLTGTAEVRELPLAEAAPTAALAPGEAWRQAFERRPGEALPRLRLVRDAPAVAVDADHYLIVGASRVRWFARLTHRPERDELRALGCTLPPGAEVVRVAAEGLGGWHREGDHLRVDLAAATRRPVALELELDLPLGDLPAIAVDAPAHLEAVRVALVEREASSYLRIDADGLTPIAGAALVGGVPAGVDASLVRRAWRGDRPDWRLALRPQTTAVEVGPDGVATLADIAVVFAADGSQRGRATWHVLERTRRQIPLRLPPGAELWELRVDGRVVRPHRDPERPELALVPIRAPRPGEGSVRISAVWRQPADATLAGGGVVAVRAPALDAVRVVQTAVTACAPAGWSIARADGTMRAIAPTQAAALRARRIGEELARLRALDPDTLGDGARRVADRLDALDVELGDHLAVLAGDPVERAEATAARGALRDERQRLDRELAAAAARRARLALDAPELAWSAPTPAAAADTPLPWPQLPVSRGQPLGAGVAPPGTVDETVAALGVELFPPLDGATATFAQPGQDWTLRLAVRPPASSPLPWLAAAAAVVFALAAVRWARTRATAPAAPAAHR